jgi:hypothetical protein
MLALEPTAPAQRIALPPNTPRLRHTCTRIVLQKGETSTEIDESSGFYWPRDRETQIDFSSLSPETLEGRCHLLRCPGLI